MTSEWVPEAQRIAKEAAEKANAETRARVAVAYGWLTDNAPSAAMLVLHSVMWGKEMPTDEAQRAKAEADHARLDAKANEVALNERKAEARDAALEIAAAVNERIACAAPCGHEACQDLRIAAERIRARKGRK